MSDPSRNPITDNIVSVDECETIREMRNNGMGYKDIAADIKRHPTTIRRHCLGRCRHLGAPKGYDDRPTHEDLIAGLRRLAEDLQRTPTTSEWDHWEDSICSSTHITDRYGTWQNALKAADLPAIATHAPVAAREAVYNKPSLADPMFDPASDDRRE